MSDTPAQKMEAYAARAIEIASQSTDPFIRERLIEMAQRWIGMAMEEEDGEGAEQLALSRGR